MVSPNKKLHSLEREPAKQANGHRVKVDVEAAIMCLEDRHIRRQLIPPDDVSKR